MAKATENVRLYYLNYVPNCLLHLVVEI